MCSSRSAKFATQTKENPDRVQGIDGLRAAVAAAHRPIVGIGGIAIAELPAVLATGVAAACLISAINDAPDVAAAAREARRPI